MMWADSTPFIAESNSNNAFYYREGDGIIYFTGHKQNGKHSCISILILEDEDKNNRDDDWLEGIDLHKMSSAYDHTYSSK